MFNRKNKKKKIGEDSVRVIKIGKEALFEFIYEKMIDEQELFLDVDPESVMNSFDIDWESGQFIFCAYKAEDQNGETPRFRDAIDLKKLMHSIPDTASTLYDEGRYGEYKKTELIELSRASVSTHEMKLKPSPFAKIKSGEKTIELRLLDEKRRKILEGDAIVFTNTETGERLSAIVLKLHCFESFEALYRSLPLLKCGYTEADIEKASPSDMEAYYPKEEQEKYGVVGIELKI